MMGRGYIEYTSPTTGRTFWVLLSAFLEYRLGDGSKLDIDQQPAWCRRCREFRLAEQIPSIEELEQSIAELQMREGPLIEHWELVFCEEKTDENIEREIARYRKRISWRRCRLSAPRCLSCGSTAVDPIPVNGEFFHPESGGRFVVSGGGWASAAPWVAVFSPEGEMLPETEIDGEY
jgi:hypothetical protein